MLAAFVVSLIGVIIDTRKGFAIAGLVLSTLPVVFFVVAMIVFFLQMQGMD